MTSSDTDSGLSRSWRGALAFVVLALLGLTTLATWQTSSLIRSNQEARLAYESSQIDVALEQRMQAYVQILRGAVGLFAGSVDVSRAEWLEYVDTLRLDDRYPGFKSLSFAPAVPEAELAGFIARVRKEPVPAGITDPALITDFTPRSPTGVPGETAIHSPILYVAPFTPENQIVLGVDMMQDPTRRAAMEAAVATDDAVLSPRLRLAGQSDQRAGFIAYVPITVEKRMIGWLTAAFRAPDMMGGLQGEASPTVAFEITDGDDGLLYSTRALNPDGSPQLLGSPEGLERSSSAVMPGRVWDVRYVTRAGFATTTEKVAPTVVAGGGLLVTVLVFAVGWTGAGWRSRAASLAAQRTIVRHQATHDALTGLANRALFAERLDQAIVGPPFALAYLDIDGFKPVNDRLGHRAGDALLVTIARRLSEQVRGEGTVARIGGDEFVVLVTDSGQPVAPDAADLRDRLTRVFADPFVIVVDDATHEVAVTASIGIARCPADGTESDALIHIADTAMFASKRAASHEFGGPD